MKRFRIPPGILIIFYMVIIDIFINIVFHYPTDPNNTSPSALQLFFEYGRSVEGKLSRMTGLTDEDSASIIKSGWILKETEEIEKEKTSLPDKPIVTIYGMSHAVLLGKDMAKLAPDLQIRIKGAAGAVPSWSYAAYLYDKKIIHSDVVILGIMTRGVSLICTTSGATNHFDTVAPYTYPRFYLSNGRLEYIMPPFISLSEYREFFFDKNKWESYKKWLRKHDKYYDSLLFTKSMIDHSSLFRMIRRAYAYYSYRKKEKEVYDDIKGFNKNSEEVILLQKIIKEFAKQARQDNSIPIIYIVNNVFMGDRLFELIEPVLKEENILFLSSHKIIPPNDPSYYDSSSHFIEKKNIELAQEMINLIKQTRVSSSILRGK